MSSTGRPPTAYVDRDEYGCFTVFPTSLVVNPSLEKTIRFVNLTSDTVQVDLPGALAESPTCFDIRAGEDGTATVKPTNTRKSYRYTVRAAGFEGRGGSGPKVIVDP